MKVMHIITSLEVGGAELALSAIAGYAQSAGVFSNSVISLTGHGPVSRKLQAVGIEVVALDLRTAAHVPRVLWQLVKAIKNARPDAVQTWLYHADLIGGIAARLAGVSRLAWGIRNTDLIEGVSPSTRIVMRICAALSYFLPKHIVCVSHSALKTHATWGYCAKKMCVISNGCVPFVLNHSREICRTQLAIPPDTIVIGSVARFNPYKDHANFIEAARRLCGAYPDVRFLMVGRNIDVHNQQLMGWIAATGYQERFIVVGEKEDVASCYAAMDIFCLHSRSEAFPNVLVEAMAAGLPCVATDVGDAALILGDTGSIVPPRDAESLANALEKIMKLPEPLRIKQGEAARDRVLARYTLSRTVQDYAALYSCT